MMTPLMAPQSDEEPERKGDDQRHAVDDGRSAHDHRAEDHDHADREVDAGGQDHQCLSNAEHRNDRHLLQDERQVERRKEFTADDTTEENQAEEEHQERNDGRKRMQEMLCPANEAWAFLLEGGNLLRCVRQHLLELGGRRPPGGLAVHAPSVPRPMQAPGEQPFSVALPIRTLAV